MAPAAGSAAPDFVYSDSDGQTRKLSEAWADGPAMVVWLRHFG